MNSESDDRKGLPVQVNGSLRQNEKKKKMERQGGPRCRAICWLVA